MDPTDSDVVLNTADAAEAEGTCRLLPSVIDDLAARKPDKVFCSLSRSPDPKDGLFNVTYGSFAGAIDNLAKFLNSHVLDGIPFETIAYIGPVDLRHQVLFCASMKVGAVVG